MGNANTIRKPCHICSICGIFVAVMHILHSKNPSKLLPYIPPKFFMKWSNYVTLTGIKLFGVFASFVGVMQIGLNMELTSLWRGRCVIESYRPSGAGGESGRLSGLLPMLLTTKSFHLLNTLTHPY